MTSRISRPIILLLSPLLLVLAGCGALPGATQTAVPTAVPTATSLSNAVAQIGGADAASPPTDAPADTAARAQSSSTATAATTAAARVPYTATAIPASATPLPSATPSPTSTATLMPTPIILAPIHLAQDEVGSTKLYPRYFTNVKAIAFSMAAPPGVTLGLRPQVEIEPLDHPYVGKPTNEGAPMQPVGLGRVVVTVGGMPEGPYHWQARLSDGQGHNGPWSNYYQGPAFRLDRTPPLAPRISSPTHPNQHATYSEYMARLVWTKPYDRGGIQGYLIGIDRKPDGLPTGPLVYVNGTTIGPLASADLYFHVRAEDWAGNLGAIATYALHIDHRAPLVAQAVFDRFQFNPQFDTLTMHFVPNKAVRVRVEIRRQSTKGLVRVLNMGHIAAGARVTVRWDGRNQSAVLVKPGLYTMVVFATDQFGNVGDGYYADLGVNYRRIVVHLATQSMQVFDGNTLLRTTLVTTGNQNLPTPPGVWHVLAKFHPYKFISPWKKGTLYWYPNAVVNYALNFHAGGYFIHDAPWRTLYGPGTNTAPGPPGVYSGTHGCVNVPADVAQWLYKWASIGTVVDILRQ